MTIKQQLADDEPLFFDTDEFAIEADFGGGLVVKGVFNEGIEGEREPRSPEFHCRDAEIGTVDHGDTCTINGQTYYVEGYQPDGFGMAVLILRRD